MMKKSLIALIILIGTMNFFSAQSTDFRGFTWGNSLADVQSSEKENGDKNATIDEKPNYGQAVADGNLTLNTVWNTSRSVIKIILITRNDRRSGLQIQYTARSLDEL